MKRKRPNPEPAMPSLIPMSAWLAIFLLIVAVLFSAYAILALTYPFRVPMPWYLPVVIYGLSLAAGLFALTRAPRSWRVYLVMLGMLDCGLAVWYLDWLS